MILCLVIPGRGRKPASPESITTILSMTLPQCANDLFAFMDSGLAAARRPGMTGA